MKFLKWIYKTFFQETVANSDFAIGNTIHFRSKIIRYYLHVRDIIVTFGDKPKHAIAVNRQNLNAMTELRFIIRRDFCITTHYNSDMVIVFGESITIKIIYSQN